jgi:hypothetical protein
MARDVRQPHCVPEQEDSPDIHDERLYGHSAELRQVIIGRSVLRQILPTVGQKTPPCSQEKNKLAPIASFAKIPKLPSLTRWAGELAKMPGWVDLVSSIDQIGF